MVAHDVLDVNEKQHTNLVIPYPRRCQAPNYIEDSRFLYSVGVSPHFSRKIFPKYALEENPHRNPISVTFISVS